MGCGGVGCGVWGVGRRQGLHGVMYEHRIYTPLILILTLLISLYTEITVFFASVTKLTN